jgi:hypothetical protein
MTHFNVGATKSSLLEQVKIDLFVCGAGLSVALLPGQGDVYEGFVQRFGATRIREKKIAEDFGADPLNVQ